MLGMLRGWLQRTRTLAVVGLTALLGVGTSIFVYVANKAYDKTVEPYISSYVVEPIGRLIDGVTCGGAAELDLGDGLSKLAGTAKSDPEADAYLKQANVHYTKAYACGQPDAGLRLAAAHCKGLGLPRNAATARRLILEVEEKHTSRLGRAGDVRRYCGL